jgi:hypothetical protein
MYITIRRFRVDPEVIDEVIDLAKNKFLPELVAIPGFKAFYHLHTGEDTLVSISIFADKTGADASNRLSQECAKEFVDILPTPPEIIEGEVVTLEVLESLITPKP